MSRASAPERYYRHSGALPPGGLTRLAAYGLAACVVAGVVYGYGMTYLPFRSLRILASLALGPAVGLTLGNSGRRGKIRSPAAMLIAGLLFGLLAFYCGSAAWIFAVTRPHLLALSPRLWLGMHIVIARHRDSPGWLLIWAIEALSVAGLCAFVAWKSLRDIPFCETCNRWVGEIELISPLVVPEIQDLMLAELEQGQIRRLESLARLPEESREFIQAELQLCSVCRQQCWLSLRHIRHVPDSKGRRKRKETTLAENMLLPVTAYAPLAQRAAEPPIEALDAPDED